jgi:crotonobetainyl-CoA:carnitine CoA-transferase CaiB-like acyl-CoA transferase
VERPLEGVRVVELTPGRATAYAARMLADLGAQVTALEPPARSRLGARRLDGELDRITFQSRKQSVAIDLAHPAARAVVERLVAAADAVVLEADDATAAELGIDEASLRAVNEGLVYGVCSSYGPLGELHDAPGADLVAQGMSGFMARTGYPGDPPQPAGTTIADSAAAMYLCSGVLAALLQRGSAGRGARVDVSRYGALIGAQSWELNSQSVRGVETGRIGRGHPDISANSICHVFEAADGWLAIGGMGSPRWEALCELLGLEELQTQFVPYGDATKWTITMEEALAQLGERFKTRPRAHWVEEFAPRGIQGGPVQDYSEIFADEQARANGYVTALAHPTRGELSVVGSPFAVVGEPAEPPPLPVEAGADTERALGELGLDGDAVARLRAEGAVR